MGSISNIIAAPQYPLFVWIRRIPQTVAQKVELQYSHYHEEPRQHQPVVENNGLYVLCILEQGTPAHRWSADTEAEETEGGLAENHTWNG